MFARVQDSLWAGQLCLVSVHTMIQTEGAKRDGGGELCTVSNLTIEVSVFQGVCALKEFIVVVYSIKVHCGCKGFASAVAVLKVDRAL